MLSILIPVYQVKVEKLVTKLIKQCTRCKIEFEILCFDDGSKESVKIANRSIDQLMRVNYVELSENMGRAKIRNRLAKSARYEYLLFLDADSKINKRDFVKTYVDVLGERKILCGGRIYAKKSKNKTKRLHWKYGVERESKSARYRSKKKVLFFHSNNFVIPRKRIYEVPFDEEIDGYGYEDLALGYRLDQRLLDIVHLDNPVVHDKLESSDRFLEKGKTATENLYELYMLRKLPQTPLIKAFVLLNRFNMSGIFQKIFSVQKLRILTNLASEKPRLIYFDLFRLNHLLEFSKEYKEKTE